jgi:hypothetical protein
MAEPLSALSLSKQNAKSSPLKLERPKTSYEAYYSATYSGMESNMPPRPPSSSEEEDFHDSISSAPTSPATGSNYQMPKVILPASPRKSRSPERAASPRKMPAESTIRFNEGLTRVIGEMQSGTTDEEDSVIHHDVRDDTLTSVPESGQGLAATESLADADETEITLHLDETVGDLSTFSAVPNADMTRFANLRGNSPAKSGGAGDWSPSKQLRTSITETPNTTRRPLQLVSRRSNGSQDDFDMTPRRRFTVDDSPTDLLNFTGQSNVVIPPPGSAPRTARRSPSGRGAFPIRVNPSATHRSQASVDRERSRGPPSPQKPTFIPATPADKRGASHLGDLLDIDLEPMATPRSIPSVTPRELETLRSDMQSQISSLSATLSGKEAEVMALKRAITDAEVRCGNSLEELRNERSARESMEHEKAEWERRGREMENVLREVRQEIMIGEREREKLRKQGDDAEKRAEEQEVKILELQTMLESSRKQNSVSPSKEPASFAPTSLAAEIDAAVKDATERVARELHSLYKSKHETKVEALKKSYAARWEKQVRELQESLKSAQDEIVKMQTERDATMSGVVPGQAQMLEALQREKEEMQAEKSMLHARIKGLEEESSTMRAENEDLRQNLDKERAEKGELVAQVDLFLSMEADMGSKAGNTGEEKPTEAPSPSKELRTSLSGGRPRPISMLKPPGKFTGTGIPGPGKTPIGRGIPRGGIMEGIARMGAGGRG